MAGPFQIAIIGCGWAGTRHAQAFAGSGAALRWLVDANVARAQGLAADYPGAQAAGDYRLALGDLAVQAVDICLPHSLHAEVALEAAAAGKHILCEKPLAATLEDADRMIAAADAAHMTLMVAENEHFNPLYQRIREMLDEGIIGRPALVQMTRECYLRQSFLRDRPWFLDARVAAGGMMMSGGVHSFDTLRMLLGEVESVQALRARQRFLEMEGDDTSIAIVRFRDGTVGTLVESYLMKSLATAAGDEIHSLRIDGDLGSLSVQDGRTIRFFSEHPSLTLKVGARHAVPLLQHELAVPFADTFALEVQHFIDCVRTGREPLTAGRLQRRNLEIVLAAYRAMETGEKIVL